MQNTSNIILVVITSALLLLVLTIIVVMLFVNLQKKRVLYFVSLDKVRVDFERNIVDAQVEMQETTFMNIAQEIHDNIGLGLTLAKLNINTITTELTGRSEELLANSRELITKAIYDLSDLSKSINTDIISSTGFIESIEHEIRRLQKTISQSISISVEGNPFTLTAQKELLIFRIFQESINNIIKHSKASHVELKLKYADDLFFQISDDGIGFDIDNYSSMKQRSSGLNNIRKRAILLDSHLDIASNPVEGTRITLKIPKNSTECPQN